MPTTALLVSPESVRSTAAAVQACAAVVLGARGELTALDATAGCVGPVGDAYGRLSAAWLAELGRLGDEAHAVAADLATSANDYATTDRLAIRAPHPRAGGLVAAP